MGQNKSKSSRYESSEVMPPIASTSSTTTARERCEPTLDWTVSRDYQPRTSEWKGAHTDVQGRPATRNPTVRRPNPVQCLQQTHSAEGIRRPLFQPRADNCRTPTQKKHMLVAAIDFGTTYSGYAFSSTSDFSRKPTDIYIRPWSGPCSISYKAPTQVLIETNGQTFKAKAFGYDADNVYANASDDEKASLYLFKRFKMSLDVQSGLNIGTEVKDVQGKSLKAMTVFSLTIGCLVDDLKNMVKKQTGGVEYRPSEILYILTVPAIWDDAAKQFMREAATKAGIPNDQLEIGLEPETAAIFCRLTTPGDCVGRNPILSNLKEGEQYMVLDAGGGTVDFTIHEVVDSRTVKEISAASGGRWGGINVDNEFIAVLKEIMEN